MSFSTLYLPSHLFRAPVCHALVLTQGPQKDRQDREMANRGQDLHHCPGTEALRSSVQQNLQRQGVFLLGRRVGCHDIFLLMALAAWIPAPNPMHELPS